jgi:hypothetical protein
MSRQVWNGQFHVVSGLGASRVVPANELSTHDLLHRLLRPRLQTEESSGGLIPNADINTSDMNLVNHDELLLLCPWELSRRWDSRLES